MMRAEQLTMVKLPTGFEVVHVVHDYCDEPRSGVADYAGVPINPVVFRVWMIVKCNVVRQSLV